jgi:hypothetical protein
MRSLFVTTVLVSGSLLASGCSSPAKSFGGKVTYKGQAVPGGTIVLHAREGAQKYTGTIRADGTFVVSDAAPGVMVVTIDNKWLKAGALEDGKAQGVDPKMLEKMMPKDPGGRRYVSIPEKYSNPKTSPLIWEIKTRNESKDFDLND